MATMTVRTTVAFDPATVARWERLAQRWGVSKSEALRRALESADAHPLPTAISGLMPTRDEIDRMSPREALGALEELPFLSAEEGVRWRRELRETREDFASQ